MIIYGTYFGGKVRRVEDQWIESKYLLLMGPLIPYKTLFVTSKDYNSRNGIEMPLNGWSVLHGFLRFYLLLGTLILLGLSIWGSVAYYNYDSQESFDQMLNYIYSPFAWGFCAAALILAWSHFQNTRSSEEETRLRIKLGAVLGINALPQWLDAMKRYEIMKNLKAQILEMVGTDNMEAAAQRTDLTPAQIGCLFAYYTYLCSPVEEHSNADELVLEKLSERLDQVINSIKPEEPPIMTEKF